LKILNLDRNGKMARQTDRIAGSGPMVYLVAEVSKGTNQPHHTLTAGGLLLAVVLWGANNVGTKWLVNDWPPVWTGGTRFLLAGLLMLPVLRFTRWLGDYQPLAPELRWRLWWRGGLSLAVYIVVFCWALRLTAVSHVALYLGASPVWSLLVEGAPRMNWATARRYGAALLALTGVAVLFWPALRHSNFHLTGECFGLLTSLLWANFNHQGRVLARHVSGVEVAAHSMWMSGVWLLPFGVGELFFHPIPIDRAHLAIQSGCILLGGVVPYALWNSALRHWQTSRVMLFNNFIPLATASWAHWLLREPIAPTFFIAMLFIAAGVLIGQTDWLKIIKT
jgi:drug/metabolite transporter (DMT)-like permease